MQAVLKAQINKTDRNDARSTMMPGTMTNQGPMTRANARVRACDSRAAGMKLSLRSVANEAARRGNAQEI
jgi:hypothetical protein